jgi:hypothetical protein
MRQTIVSLVDDLDGSEAAETVSFGIDGVAYEIDLSAAHALALRSTVDTWVTRARPAGEEHRGEPTRVTRLTTVLPAVGESRNALIRAWAAETGQHAPARGRLPQAVVNAYDSAHR